MGRDWKFSSTMEPTRVIEKGRGAAVWYREHVGDCPNFRDPRTRNATTLRHANLAALHHADSKGEKCHERAIICRVRVSSIPIGPNIAVRGRANGCRRLPCRAPEQGHPGVAILISPSPAQPSPAEMRSASKGAASPRKSLSGNVDGILCDAAPAGATPQAGLLGGMQRVSCDDLPFPDVRPTSSVRVIDACGCERYWRWQVKAHKERRREGDGQAEPPARV